MGLRIQSWLIIAIGVALAFGVSELCIAAGGHTQVGTGLPGSDGCPKTGGTVTDDQHVAGNLLHDGGSCVARRALL